MFPNRVQGQLHERNKNNHHTCYLVCMRPTPNEGEVNERRQGKRFLIQSSVLYFTYGHSNLGWNMICLQRNRKPERKHVPVGEAMHSNTFIFLKVCMVRNLQMQSGMLDWYDKALTALGPALLAWVGEKHRSCNDTVCKSWEQPLCFPDIWSCRTRQLVLHLIITLFGIASPSQCSGSPVFTGLASREAQIDFSGTLLVYAIPTFSFQGSHASQFSVTEVFKRWPSTLPT